MSLLLDLLAPLLKKRDTYYIVAIIVLVLLFVGAKRRYVSDEAALAARPAVHETAEQQVKVVKVAGPVRVETRTVYKPGTTQVVYVDRVVDSSPVTTTTEKQSEVVKDVKPACPAAPAARNRFVGVQTSPLNQKAIGVEVGMTLFGAIDARAGYEFYGSGQDRIRLGAGYRF